jgi:HTH-type transcriptional regulator / antitoxin HigA
MYDEYVAREKRKTLIDDARNWARKFPFSTMAKLGWVDACREVDGKVAELF